MSLFIKDRLLLSLAATVVIVAITGCSAEKNTLTSRLYHNLTSKYNILFNGEQSYLNGIERIEQNFTDDYSGVLPVFVYGTEQETSVANSYMDRAVEKASKVITLHSVTAKPAIRGDGMTEKQREFYAMKEYNRYVDDAYLLMGSAYFYKHEYTLAERVFLQVQNDFKGSPEAYESQVWLARIYNETGRLRFANEIFDQLENNAAFPEKQLGFLYASMADYHLKQNNYPRALDYVSRALETRNSKKTRTRYLFILAQLYEKTGDYNNSSATYGKVISMNPPFEMAFHARINQALTYSEGHGNYAEIENELSRMLRDDKYNDYQDQVYYALGDFYLATGDSVKALENYVKSVDMNTGNAGQQLRSFITIADYYYKIPDYIKAEAFYDSALTVATRDYDGYDALVKKESSLSALVRNLNTIALEDSVQKLAALDRATLNARIDELIALEREKRQLEQDRREEERLDRQYATQVASENRSSGTGSQWYFYNETAKSLGYNEFKVVWGNRPLEDHWQRSDKTALAFATENGGVQTEEAADEITEAVTAGNPLSRDYYMAAIPLTDSAKAASNTRVENSLYESGLIYMNELGDLNRAADAFRELIQRFPASQHVLPAYYNLYAISGKTDNIAMEEYYKGIIISRYPDTNYAMVLNNPGYALEQEQNRKLAEKYYEETFELYRQGNDADVVSRAAYAMQTFDDQELLRRFAYIAVLAEGRNSDRETFRRELVSFAAQYPGTEMAEDALMIVAFIEREEPEIAQKAETETIAALYSFNNSVPHSFVYVLDGTANYNQLIFNIINFNLDNYDVPGIDAEMINFTPRQNFVVVKGFGDGAEAAEYLQLILGEASVTDAIPGVSPEPFVISDENLKTLLNDSSLSRYLQFYNENYR